MAAPYSMDLRQRVFKAWKASGDADEVAATFGASRAWVHRLAQRERETHSLAARKPTTFRSRRLAGQEDRLKALVLAKKPDATLAELRDRLPTTAALSTLWVELDRLDLTVKKIGQAEVEQLRAGLGQHDVAGFRSRCTMPARCALSSASEMSMPMVHTCSRGSGPCACGSRSASVSLSRYSITK